MARRGASRAIEDLYAILRPKAETVARAEFPDAREINVTFYGERVMIAIWEKGSKRAKMYTWTPEPEDFEEVEAGGESSELDDEGTEIVVEASGQVGEGNETNFDSSSEPT